MRAGPMRHRVTVQSKVVTRSNFGDELVTWEDVDTRWASVEPLRGNEFLEARVQQIQVDTRIRMRFWDGITTDMRLVYDGRIFVIDSIINVWERNRETHVMCREIRS